MEQEVKNRNKMGYGGRRLPFTLDNEVRLLGKYAIPVHGQQETISFSTGRLTCRRLLKITRQNARDTQ